LAIYGLPGQVAHSLLNEVAPRMIESSVALQTGDRVEGVLVDDVPLVVVAMADARYRRAATPESESGARVLRRGCVTATDWR
jgi:hypothetical protein